MTEIRMRRGPASRLPVDAADGEPLLTTDTHNIYIGGGPGVMPVKVTGVTYEIQQAIAMKANTGDLGTAAAKNVPVTGNASAGQVVLGNDSRLSNSRTPNSHKASHAAGGADAMTPEDIGAVATDDLPWVDVRSFMDGQSGRPTLDAWNAAQLTTDVSSVIVAALNSITSGTVFLPYGTYLVGSAIAFTGSHKNIVGNSATLLTTATNNQNLISLSSSNAYIDISGITFKGAADVNEAYTVGVYGVDVYQSADNTIHDCVFDTLHIGVYLRDDSIAGSTTYRNKVRDNKFLAHIQWSSGHAGYGVLSTYAQESDISGNKFIGPIGRHSVYLSVGTHGTKVLNNTMKNCGLSPIQINSGTIALKSVEDNIISGNVITGPGAYVPFAFGIALTGDVNKNIISNNRIDQAGDSGIMLQASSDTYMPTGNTITGNIVTNSQWYSLWVYDAVNNVVIGNQFVGGNQANTVVYDINIQKSLTTTASGNVISGNTSSPLNAVRHNIYFGVGTANNIAKENVCANSSRIDILNDGTVTNKIIPLSGGLQTPTWASTMTLDARLGETVKVTLGGNTSFASPAYQMAGQKMTLILTQDATGGRTVAWGSAYDVQYGGVNIAPNAETVLTFVSDGTKFRQVAKLPNKVAVPASAIAVGSPGQWAADSSYYYVYTGDGATHTWRRIATATW